MKDLIKKIFYYTSLIVGISILLSTICGVIILAYYTSIELFELMREIEISEFGTAAIIVALISLILYTISKSPEIIKWSWNKISESKK